MFLQKYNKINKKENIYIIFFIHNIYFIIYYVGEYCDMKLEMNNLQ